MHKIRIIAIREYLLTVKAWPFWLITLGLPVLMFLGGLVIFLVTYFSVTSMNKPTPEKTAPKVVGIVDPIGFNAWENEQPASQPGMDKDLEDLLAQFSIPDEWKKRVEEMMVQAPASTWQYEVFADQESGRQALDDQQIRGLLVLPEGFPGDTPVLWLKNSDTGVSVRGLERRLRLAMLEQIAGELDANQILQPLEDLETQYLEEAPPEQVEEFDLTGEVQKFVPPFFYMMMLMLVIFTSTERLLRGLVEEKSNRVIEVLLSSVTADQLMAGKVIGLSLAGLTQLLIWLVIGLLPFSFVLVFIEFNLATFTVFLVFFLLGYFFIATLLVGVGSLGNNLQEANQWTAIFIVLSLLPTMFMYLLVRDPDGTLAMAFTFFPLSSSITVLFRYGAGAIAPWELLAAGVLLLLFNVLAVKVSARIFRVGIMLTGKAPTPKALYHALRQQ